MAEQELIENSFPWWFHGPGLIENKFPSLVVVVVVVVVVAVVVVVVVVVVEREGGR